MEGKQGAEEQLRAAVSSPEKAFANPAWAKVHGYGFSESAMRAHAGKQVGLDGGPALSSKADAAFSGTGPMETVDLGNGQGQLGYSTTGCAAGARQLELSIASADAECTVSSGYDVSAAAAEKAVARSAGRRLSGTIAAFLEMRGRALTRAARILAS